MPPAFARCCDDRRLQLAVGEILQLAVDRQREIAAFDRRAHALDVLDDPPEPVLDHAAAAGFAGQPVLVGELDAFLAAVIDVGEADQTARSTSPAG